MYGDRRMTYRNAENANKLLADCQHFIRNKLLHIGFMPEFHKELATKLLALCQKIMRSKLLNLALCQNFMKNNLLSYWLYARTS